MSKTRRCGATLLCVLLLAAITQAVAGEARIAVASNFTAAAKQLVTDFERSHPHRIRLSFGSTGKLYTQIYNGAPFDAFLAADVDRPELAEREGLAVAGSRFTYALGKLALWSASQGTPPSGAAGETLLLRLQQGDYRRLAVANPKLAPYGSAALEALQRLRVRDHGAKLVFGENIAQAYQFVATGNAEFGLVALAQISLQGERQAGRYWEVPESYYPPILQQAVLLTRGAGSPAAQAFLAYLREAGAQAIIRRNGYGI